MGLGHALAPAGFALALEPQQQERAVVRSSETRLEEVGQRQAEQADVEAIDVHGQRVS